LLALVVVWNQEIVLEGIACAGGRAVRLDPAKCYSFAVCVTRMQLTTVPSPSARR
jgi:hypothetical protein